MYRLNFRNYQPMNMILKTNEGNQLWLGDYGAATDINLLKQKNIKHVLTVAAMLNIQYPKQQSIKHKVINALDLPTYKMTKHFEEAHQFISNALEHGHILVHCAAGISRSTTCVLVYLMKTRGLTFKQSLEFTRKKRPIVNPNYGFQNQLIRLEQTLKNSRLTKNQKKVPKTTQSLTEEERKAVLNFIKDQTKTNKLNSTFGGVKDTKLLPKAEDQMMAIRGKSQNYRTTFQNDSKTQVKINNNFLTFKLEAPKIITIKK